MSQGDLDALLEEMGDRETSLAKEVEELHAQLAERDQQLSALMQLLSERDGELDKARTSLDRYKEDALAAAKEELRSDAERKLRERLATRLSEELRGSVQQSLRAELTPQVREEVRRQLLDGMTEGRKLQLIQPAVDQAIGQEREKLEAEFETRVALEVRKRTSEALQREREQIRARAADLQRQKEELADGAPSKAMEARLRAQVASLESKYTREVTGVRKEVTAARKRCAELEAVAAASHAEAERLKAEAAESSNKLRDILNYKEREIRRLQGILDAQEEERRARASVAVMTERQSQRQDASHPADRGQGHPGGRSPVASSVSSSPTASLVSSTRAAPERPAAGLTGSALSASVAEVLERSRRSQRVERSLPGDSADALDGPAGPAGGAGQDDEIHFTSAAMREVEKRIQDNLVEAPPEVALALPAVTDARRALGERSPDGRGKASPGRERGEWAERAGKVVGRHAIESAAGAGAHQRPFRTAPEELLAGEGAEDVGSIGSAVAGGGIEAGDGDTRDLEPVAAISGARSQGSPSKSPSKSPSRRQRLLNHQESPNSSEGPESSLPAVPGRSSPSLRPENMSVPADGPVIAPGAASTTGLPRTAEAASTINATPLPQDSDQMGALLSQFALEQEEQTVFIHSPSICVPAGRAGALLESALQFLFRLWDRVEEAFLNRNAILNTLRSCLKQGAVEQALKIARRELIRCRRVDTQYGDVYDLIRQREQLKVSVSAGDGVSAGAGAGVTPSSPGAGFRGQEAREQLPRVTEEIIQRLADPEAAAAVLYRSVPYVDILRAEGALQ